MSRSGKCTRLPERVTRVGSAGVDGVGEECGELCSGSSGLVSLDRLKPAYLETSPEEPEHSSW